MNDDEGGMYGGGRGALEGISNVVALILVIEAGSLDPLLKTVGGCERWDPCWTKDCLSEG